MNTLTLATLFALAALTATATPFTCPPSLSGSTAVDPACTGLGQSIFANASTTGQVWFEDQNRRTPPDFDYNDSASSFAINSLGTQATFTFLGANAGFNNQLWLGGTLLYSNLVHPAPVTATVTPGQEIVLELRTPDGHSYFTGPGSRNSDGLIHAWVTQTTNGVPEPTTLSMAALGMALVCLRLAGRRSRV